MKKREVKNIAASVKQRLLTLSRECGEEFNLLLIRYGIERFLYRLSQSEHADSFVLKGASLFHFCADASHRPTRDIDLLSRGSSDPARLKEFFEQVAGLEMGDDGMTFDPSSIYTEPIRREEEYEGVRVHLKGRLGTARLSLQIDVGFGDAVTPRPRKRLLRGLLDFEPPQMRIYPWETVIAEKYQAMVDLGMTNSRMKDFFDLRHIAREFEFEGKILSKAIQATFRRRKTDLPEGCPLALTLKFTQDPAVGARWRAFLQRSKLRGPVPDLASVADEIWAFLRPVTEALLAQSSFEKAWNPGGPWR
jgi:hypothetical protein